MAWREHADFGRVEAEVGLKLEPVATASRPSSTNADNKDYAIALSDAAVGSKPAIAMSDGSRWNIVGSPDEVISAYFADIGTAGSTYIRVPFAGVIRQIAVVLLAANGTTKTVFTPKIGVAGTGITLSAALETGATSAAGSAFSVSATAANVVAAGDIIDVLSDGGSTSTTPAMVYVVVARSVS